MKQRTLLLAVVAALAALPAQSEPLVPTAIPSPRPEGWVVDLAHLLTAEQEAELNLLGDQVHTNDGAVLAILTVSQTGGVDPRQAATEVFRHWELGDDERANGLLIFVSIGDRAAEVILGDGIDSDEEVAKSDGIMENVLVANFRRGAPDDAILEGARAYAQQFFGVGPPPLEAPPGAIPLAATPPAETVKSEWWHLPLLGLVLLLGLGAVVGLIAGVVLLPKWLRNRPRKCPRCQEMMTRLDESQDDRHLAPGEQAEERVGSVDYDVWWCSRCQHVEKVRRKKFFTSYSRCPQCQSVTATQAKRTLQAATTHSTGLMEIQESCSHCHYQSTTTSVIPRDVPATSSSSRSFSSGGGSSGGGGSTSGRGSSGRW